MIVRFRHEKREADDEGNRRIVDATATAPGFLVMRRGTTDDLALRGVARVGAPAVLADVPSPESLANTIPWTHDLVGKETG